MKLQLPLAGIGMKFKTLLMPIKQGCLCAECEVAKEHELTGGYFCVNGKAE